MIAATHLHCIHWFAAETTDAGAFGIGRCRLVELAIVVVILGWKANLTDASDFIKLHDVTERTGIDFRHTDGSSGAYYIVEAMSAGLALFRLRSRRRYRHLFSERRAAVRQPVERAKKRTLSQRGRLAIHGRDTARRRGLQAARTWCGRG